MSGLATATILAAWYGFSAAGADDGLGRGGVDQFLRAEAGYEAGGASLAVSLTHQLIAEPGWRDPTGVAITLTRRLGKGASLGAGFEALQSLAPGYPAQASVSLFAGRSVGRAGRIDLYVSRGLNAVSGASAGIRFTRSLGAE